MSDDNYSVSQSRDALACLAHDAEGGRHEAIDEYQKSSAPKPGGWSAISQFRTHDLTAMDDLADKLTAGARSRNPGRDLGASAF